MLFTRELESDLNSWLVRSSRKPLIIRGARQVGKSTLVSKFAQAKKLKLIDINLELHAHLDSVFATFDTDRILRELEGIANSAITSKNPCLLFLDEIQATPAGIAALRYFHEKLPWLPVIAAGSLLEFALREFEYSIPVGRVEYRYLRPFSFKEFLMALGETLLLENLDRLQSVEIAESVHTRLLARQREYLYLGGMPEVIKEFVESGSLSQCRQVQTALVESFRLDFSRYASGAKMTRLQRVFNALPAQICQKVKYVNFSREDKSREIKESIDQLIMAQLCHPIYHSDCSGLPLAASQDYNTYKLIFIDVGLLNCVLNAEWSQFAQFDAHTLINEGPIAEQFVGQELLCLSNSNQNTQLNYWLRQKRTANAEVDYVLAHNQNIVPIEVKSGKSGSLRSLHVFAKEKKSKILVRFDLNPVSKVSLNIDGQNCELRSLPLYAVAKYFGE
jgi:uncharacterized protein